MVGRRDESISKCEKARAKMREESSKPDEGWSKKT